MCTFLLFFLWWPNGKSPSLQEVFAHSQHHPKEVIEYLQTQNTTVYDFGMDLLAAGMMDESLMWFQNMAAKTNDPKCLYGRAWVFWEKGLLVRAKEDLKFLETQNPSKLLQARSQYLLGLIFLQEPHDFTQAEAAFQKSFELYKTLNKRGGIYRVACSLAFLHARQGNADAAQRFLDVAIEANKQRSKPSSFGLVYEIQAQISFRAGEYSEAAEWAEKAYETYGEDKEVLASIGARVYAGLFSTLSGRVEKGYEIALWADSQVVEHNLKVWHHINNCHWILLYRCFQRGSQFDSQEIVKEIEDFTHEHNHAELRNLLTFVQQYPCPN